MPRRAEWMPARPAQLLAHPMRALDQGSAEGRLDRRRRRRDMPHRPRGCGKGLWVAEDRQGLFVFGQVLGAENNGDGASVAGDRDALVLLLDAVDDLAEVVADGATRLNGHAHNRGAHAPFRKR